MTFVSNLGIAFDQVLQQYANRTALFYPATGIRISYHELSSQADQIALILQQRGICRGQVAAIFHNKSPGAFAAMIACLRLGIIYTNLDPDSPWERLHKMLGVCQPSVIINSFESLPHINLLLDYGCAEVINLGDFPFVSTPYVTSATSQIANGSAAYIMFTSGSTGVPKGALMSHANLLWFIAWAKERFDITPDDVLTNVNPMYFDNSVFDFYLALFTGATLIPITFTQVRDTRLLVRLLNEAACTLWFSVPSLLVYLLTTRALKGEDFPLIRKLLFGGEGFPKARLRQLYNIFGQRADLENVYGPTECTCICSAYTISPRDFDDMQSLAPLGALSQNFSFEIFPSKEEPSDLRSGELFLRGPQVGLGYYNDLDRTAKSFIQNPAHTHYTDIGYRTGDIVRQDASGCLHFKGRVDFQIKHMGYRIELEEIEAALNSLPGVLESAVIYQLLSGEIGQILGFAAVNLEVNSEILLEQIAVIVPQYMLPRRIIILKELPKNANGKIDRTALMKGDF